MPVSLKCPNCKLTQREAGKQPCGKTWGGVHPYERKWFPGQDGQVVVEIWQGRTKVSEREYQT